MTAPTLGLDGSRWQTRAGGGDPDFSAIRSGGVQWIAWNTGDPDYLRRMQEAHAAGLQCASYRYVTAAESIVLAADDLVARARASGVPHLFIALDVEEGGGDQTDRVRAGLQQADSHGFAQVLLYSGNWWIGPHIRANATALAHWPLWDAVYNGTVNTTPSPPWTSVAVHQFTSSAHVPGIAGNVDEDWLISLGAVVIHPPAPTPIPPPPPPPEASMFYLDPNDNGALWRAFVDQTGSPFARRWDNAAELLYLVDSTEVAQVKLRSISVYVVADGTTVACGPGLDGHWWIGSRAKGADAAGHPHPWAWAQTPDLTPQGAS